MSNFIPIGTYLHVKSIEEDNAEDTGILLPTDYRAVDKPFAEVEVIASSADSNTLWGSGVRLIVEAQMLRDIQHNGETITIIKEQYIVGILT